MSLPSTSRRLLRRPSVSPNLRAGAKVSEHRLTNGLRVLLAERHADPVVASVLFYNAGARTETEREAGISHFLEHMMFKGTPRFGKGEVDRLTALSGGQNNAFTGYDHTAYWFELAADRWERALELESDRMRHLSLDPAEFDAERAVVLEELAMGEDDPWRALARRVEEVLFPHHPYGRPIIGYPDTLKALRPEDMHAYRARFYHPGNATLVVAGDFEQARALAAIDAQFGDLAGGKPLAEVDCFRRALEEPRGERRVTMTWDDPARRLIVTWPTVKVATSDDDALDLAMLVLASGRTSRLFRELVQEKGLATSLSAANDSRVETGAFWIYAECAQEADPAKLEAAVHAAVAKMAQEPVTKQELERAKAMLVASEAYEAESVTDIAEELGEWATDADWKRAFDGCPAHLALSARDVQAAVAKYLVPARRVVGWCFPKEEGAPKKARTSRKAPKKAAKSKAKR